MLGREQCPIRSLVNRNVIGRPMTYTSTGSTNDFEVNIAQLLMGRIRIQATSNGVKLPTANEMCGITNLVDGEGFSCTFTNLNTSTAANIKARTGANDGTTRFYGYADGYGGNSPAIYSNTSGCKIRALRSVVLHFVKFSGNTIEIHWDGDNIVPYP